MIDLTPADAALLTSARIGTLDQMRAALAAGANIEARDHDDWATPLLAASYWNSDPAVSAHLIEQGARLDVVDKLGDTVLHGFAHNGSLALAQLALARGVPIAGVNHAGKTALHYAASSHQPDMIAFLVAHGASPHAGAFRTALHDAMSATPGGDATIYALVAAGADVKATNAAGDPPLLVAAMCNNAAGCARLLAHGAAVDAQGGSHDTALVRAARYGAVGAAAVLLAGGADPLLESPDKESFASLAPLSPALAQMYAAWRAQKAMHNTLGRARAAVGDAESDNNPRATPP